MTTAPATDGRSPEGLATDPRHIGRARQLARHHARRLPWLADEFESAAMEALWQCALRFDPARGVPFGVYLGRRVRGAIRDAMRLEAPLGDRWVRSPLARRPRTTSIDREWGRRGDGPAARGGETTGASLLIDRAPPVGTAMAEAEEFHRACRGVSERGRAILWAYVVEGLFQREIGRRLGISQGHIGIIVADALAFLRRSMTPPARGGAA